MISRVIGCYLIFLLVLLGFSYLFVDRNLLYLKFLYTGFYTEHRYWTTFIYILFLIIHFGFYAYFLRNIKLIGSKIKFLIFSTCIILFLSYPAMLSYDIFNYVATSKVLYGYGENPYILMPNEFINDPVLEFTRATNKIALYGPSWLIVSAIPFFFGFGNFLLTLFGFKLISSIFYIATSFLIFKITKNIFSTVFFALNPLVVTESLISSHNDIFMIFFALLSFTFISQGQRIKGLISLTISIFVKYATIFLFPVFLYSLWKFIRNNKSNLGLIYQAGAISMIIIFCLSFFREEIYPWYAIWFLPFVSTIPHKRILVYLSLGVSAGLMLSYVPFMMSGNYFGLTPYLKTALIILPTASALLFAMKRRLWLKNLFSQQ